jgi:hypothetical protein
MYLRGVADSRVFIDGEDFGGTFGVERPYELSKAALNEGDVLKDRHFKTKRDGKARVDARGRMPGGAF